MVKISLLKTVSALALAALLLSIVGCENRGTLPTTLGQQPSALQQRLSNKASSAVAGSTKASYAFANRTGTIGNESLEGKATFSHPYRCLGGAWCVSFHSTGHATGPYLGVFTVSGHWVNSGSWGGNSFTVTSGNRKITGLVVWTPGSGMTYKARLMREGKVLKRFHGNAILSFRGQRLSETLY
jgi:hypothetical protein